MVRFLLTHPELNEEIKFEKKNWADEDFVNEKDKN